MKENRFFFLNTTLIKNTVDFRKNAKMFLLMNCHDFVQDSGSVFLNVFIIKVEKNVLCDTIFHKHQHPM